ncbi:MAG TPA: WcaF family extracellular polysaccharide biosynthesis acetyltransferase [Patescibacteria group bacterium]|nr:WcaF family extracellular polysaccharide biosynthesis acetyltransferase [Patescibacteria group bacterium]
MTHLAKAARRYQRLEEFQPGERGRPRWVVLVWQIVQATLFSGLPHAPNVWRRGLLRCFGASIGQDVVLRPSLRVHFPWRLSIGDRSWIGDEVRLYSLGEIHIGSDTVISQRSHLCAGSHDYRDPRFPTLLPPIIIGNEVWLAAEVFVAPGLRIGDGAVVGARSAVFTDLEGGLIYRGAPAKAIGPRQPATD